MTVIEMSVRELALAGKNLEEADYVKIKDKKQKKYRGVFIPARHIARLEKTFIKDIEKEKQKKIDEMMQFAGMASGLFGEKTIQEIKSEMNV